MSGKWLELLKEVAPQVERVGFMMHPETPAHIRYFKSAETLSPSNCFRLSDMSRSSSRRQKCGTEARVISLKSLQLQRQSAANQTPPPMAMLRGAEYPEAEYPE
jgi:hypothetical protein